MKAILIYILGVFVVSGVVFSIFHFSFKNGSPAPHDMVANLETNSNQKSDEVTFEADLMLDEIKVKEIYDSKIIRKDYIKGIDVSKYQGDIDWKKVKDDGNKFVFAKATEGADFYDPKFLEYSQGANKEGLLFGAYHFYRLCEDAKAQVNDFYNTANKAVLTLPPVIDLELYRNCRHKFGTSTEIEIFKEFFNRTSDKFKVHPIIYTTVDTYNEYIEMFNSLSTSSYILFARITDRDINGNDYTRIFGLPGDNEDIIRKIFKQDWVFWQACDVCKVNGINGDVDVNYFRGGLDEMRKLNNKL